MPSGFRTDTDGWTKQFDECKQLAQETLQLIQERNLRHPNGGPEASRLSAAARKKLGTLGVNLDRLLRWLDSPEAESLWVTFTCHCTTVKVHCHALSWARVVGSPQAPR